MHISNWVVLGAAEIFAVLVVLFLLLLLHTRNLKGIASSLRERIRVLVNDLKQAKADIQKAEAQSNPREAYINQLDLLIAQTRAQHASHNPDRDIILDLSNDTPHARQIAALRFAALICEKEAILSSDTATPNWKTIEVRFTRLIEFFRNQTPLNDGDSIEATHLRQELEANIQRVENLEKFKLLFFTMEDQWRNAKQQADIYHDRLSLITMGTDQKETYKDLLSHYHNAYGQLAKTFESNPLQREANIQPQANTIVLDTTIDNRAQHELSKLKTVAADQYRIINELQVRLQKASTDAEKIEVITDLQKQLDRQVRFAKESETCIQLLEAELLEAHQHIQMLETNINSLNAQQLPQIQTAIAEHTAESKAMLKIIEQLEQENHQLAQQAELATTPAPGTPHKEELSRLKQQYTELEARYLDLRMRS